MRWVPTTDARPRDHVVPPGGGFPDIEPPVDLGRFNCRGDYVYGDGSRIPAEVFERRRAVGQPRVGAYTPEDHDPRWPSRRALVRAGAAGLVCLAVLGVLTVAILGVAS